MRCAIACDDIGVICGTINVNSTVVQCHCHCCWWVLLIWLPCSDSGYTFRCLYASGCRRDDFTWRLEVGEVYSCRMVEVIMDTQPVVLVGMLDQILMEDYRSSRRF